MLKYEDQPEARLLLRRVRKDEYSTFLGNVEYVRVDILDALGLIRNRHIQEAKARNFNDCGCDFCEALSPIFPIAESLTAEAG
jgi:hypothetical protein